MNPPSTSPQPLWPLVSLLAWAILCPAPAGAASHPSSIQFNGETYKREAQLAVFEAISVEYRAKADKKDPVEKIIVLRRIFDATDPASAARNHVQAIRKANPSAQTENAIKPDGTQALVTQFFSNPKTGITEYALTRYFPVREANEMGNYQFMVRTVGPDPEIVRNLVSQHHDRWMEAMTTANWPVPDPPSSESQARKAIQSADKLYKKNQLNEAVTKLAEAAEENPRNPDLQLALGQYLYVVGQRMLGSAEADTSRGVFKGSERHLQRAIRLLSSSDSEKDKTSRAQANFYLGELYYHFYRQAEAARQHYQATLDLIPNHAGAHVGLDRLSRLPGPTR